ELYGAAEVRDPVVQRFGTGVLRDGEIDRGALAGVAFATDHDRRWFWKLLWPPVGGRMAAWRSEREGSSRPPRALVVEVPLLFESGHGRGYDAKIEMIADERIRTARA